jgi:hypothetical protein
MCGHKVVVEHLQPTRPLKGQPQASAPLYSAPSDNKCASYGGCAIPISASQLYPVPDSTKPDQKVAYMEVYNFVGQTAEPDKIGLLRFEVGERVYDVAWKAYVQVLEHRKQPVPAQPKDSDLRLAFPPST